MVATASSLAFSAGGFTVKALLITAFLCYSISVLLVGLVNLGDFMESVVLPVAGAILSILAGKMSWYMKGYIPPGLFFCVGNYV